VRIVVTVETMWYVIVPRHLTLGLAEFSVRYRMARLKEQVFIHAMGLLVRVDTKYMTYVRKQDGDKLCCCTQAQSLKQARKRTVFSPYRGRQSEI
jgi:hypothetical protein